MNYVISTLTLGLLLLGVAVSTGGAQEDVCQLPPAVGHCRALIPRFYYDSSSGQCQFFHYGGCGGNGNSFKSLEACQGACIRIGPFPSRNKECNLPKVAGLCRAYFRSYYYNTHSGRCAFFIYGGCGGNTNRFSSKQQCQEACSP
ncbi:hypothetical protein ACOMHN_039163 [Nucella lapillus]